MIRQAQTKDISRIAEIIVFGKRVAYRDIFRDDIGSFVQLQVLDVVNELAGAPGRLASMLVYDDGIVKGVIRCSDDGEEAELCEFYVEPFFKGQGIGRALLQAFLENAVRRGRKRIYLWVIKDNLSARRFYERSGFRAAGEERLIEGTQVMDVCYEIILEVTE